MNITKTIDFENCTNIDHDIYNKIIQGRNPDQDSVSTLAIQLWPPLPALFQCSLLVGRHFNGMTARVQ